MANFTKGDLSLDYTWTAAANDDNAKITGFPDNIYLNRNEGYEVLHFLNRYMTGKNWSDKLTLNKLEKAVRDSQPGQKRKHSEVRAWLDNNFTK